MFAFCDEKHTLSLCRNIILDFMNSNFQHPPQSNNVLGGRGRGRGYNRNVRSDGRGGGGGGGDGGGGRGDLANDSSASNRGANRAAGGGYFRGRSRGRGRGAAQSARLWQQYERDYTQLILPSIIRSSFSIMTYNLLAQSLCDPADFPPSSVGLLPWRIRERKLLADIARENPDIVCLQVCVLMLVQQKLKHHVGT
jgi:hypothetical protein